MLMQDSMTQRGRYLPLLALLVGTLVALAAIASPTLAHGDDDDPDDAPTYWHDVKPILDANCTTCHQPGEIAGLYPLTTYDEVVMAAPVMGESIITDYMPPWPPAGGDNPALMHERTLSQDEKDTLTRWLFTLEEGDPADYAHADMAMTDSMPQVRPDVTLEMPVEYTPDDSMLDDYRCFLIDPELDEDVYVTGFNIIPGEPSVVHHVLLFKADQRAVAQAATLEAEDDRPGWTCFGGPRVTQAGSIGRGGLSGSASIASSIGAWAPGTPPTVFPPGTGDLLRADDMIVMQVHYNLEAGTVPDRTSAVLQVEPATDDIMALGAVNLVAPVEIPCPEGVVSPMCDRSEVIAEQTRIEGGVAQARANGLLAACNRSLVDYAGQPADSASSNCDRRIPVDGFAVASAGHMHELGASISIVLNQDHPGREEVTLLDIPAWDFHWQGAYEYVTPIPVQRGDWLTINCTWDNSDGERYVVWGEGTSDEMCLGSVTILPLPQGMTHEAFMVAHPELFNRADGMMADGHDHGDMADGHDHGDMADGHDHGDMADGHDHGDMADGHDHGDMADGHDHGDMADGHDHDAMVEAPADAVPTLALRTVADGAGGHILLLDVTNFSFAPDAVDGAHVPGQGHAHLYIDGEKIGRIYSTAYNLGSLPSGEHSIMVTLNANDHATYAVDGEPIEAMIALTIP